MSDDDDRCPVSQRADGQHSWKFLGDDPYIECFYCGELRDALTGITLRYMEEP